MNGCERLGVRAEPEGRREPGRPGLLPAQRTGSVGSAARSTRIENSTTPVLASRVFTSARTIGRTPDALS